MNDTYDILCVGTSLVDLIIRGFDPTPVSAAGFRAESASLSVGGEAVNESMAITRLGMRAAILCFLGEDAAGDMVAETLSRCGVDVSRIVRSPEHPTPVTTVFLNDDGTRRSITNGAHRFNFHPERYPHLFADARAVILGSLFRAPFDDPEVIRAAALSARERGALVFADTKLPNFRTLTLEDIAPALPLIDYITPNEDEARFYSGRDDPEAMADAFLERGVRNVIIKLGGKGCFFKNARESISLPACPVDVIDATGAGDNFLAGFVTELLRGCGHGEALRFANACGAICTTALGAGTALRSREQVLALLSRSGR